MKKPLLIITGIICLLFFSNNLSAQYYGAEDEAIKPFSLGIKVGSSALWGEIEPDPLKSYEVGITMQQVLSRLFDFRIQLHHGQARGLGRSPGDGITNNTAWNGEALSEPAPNYVDPGSSAPFFNNQTQYFDGSVQLKINLNRIFFQEANNWDFYIYGGVGTFLFQTKVDALDATKNEYDFSGIPSDDPQTVSSLRELLDGTFETPAEQQFFSSSKVGDFALVTSWGGGAGLRFRMGESMALGLEARYLDTNEYLTDGVQWNEQDMSTSRTDKLLSGALTLEFILKKKDKF